MNKLVKFTLTSLRRLSKFLSLNDPSVKATLIGTFIGSIFTLLGFFVSDWLTRRKEEEQKTEIERNKMIYLHFLITDSFRAVESLDSAAIKLSKAYKTNPFVFPGFRSYPGHSIDAIANKINQEEYFLASLSQIRGEEMKDVFLLYNTLHTAYASTTKKFDEQRLEFEKKREKYKLTLDELVYEIMQFNNNNDINKLNAKDKQLYIEVQRLMLSVMPQQEANMPMWYRDAPEIFIGKLTHILTFEGDEKHSGLLKLAYRAQREHHDVVGHVDRMVQEMNLNRGGMDGFVAEIRRLTIPFEKYINSISAK